MTNINPKGSPRNAVLHGVPRLVTTTGVVGPMDAVGSGEDSRRRRATSSRGMNVPRTSQEGVGGLMPSWAGRWKGGKGGECGVGNSSKTRGWVRSGEGAQALLDFFGRRHGCV